MPGRYRKNYKRNYRRRYNNGTTLGIKNSTWGNVGRVANKALSIASKVASMVNVEYKYNVITQTGVMSSNAGTLVTLNSVAQNSSVSGRTGDSIKMIKLALRYEFVQNATLQEEVRFIVFWDHENIITTGAQLLSNTGSNLVTMSPKNEDNRYDTKFLYDKVHKVTTNNPIIAVDEVIDLDKHTHFNAGTATIDKGALKIAYFSQAVAGSSIVYISRITYVDN